MPRQCRLTIPLETPSLNTTLRMGWPSRRRWKRDARLLVRNQLQLQGRASFPHRDRIRGRVEVRITRYCYRRIMDRDNLYGGVKELVDVLKEEELFVDDDEQHIDLIVEQRLDREYRRTEVLFVWEEPLIHDSHSESLEGS